LARTPGPPVPASADPPKMTPLLVPAALLVAATTSFRPAAAALLLRQTREDPEEEDPVKKIHEKWDKMDDFVEIMFTMACKWKHGADVNGLAAHKLKSGKLKDGEVTAFKAKTQARNVQHLKAACGNIVANGKKKCRQGCAGRWGAAMGKRSSCDAKCVKVYDHFESECLIKADNLEKVYAMKLDRSAARKQCHEGHCPNIPTTWMMTKKEDMTGEVEKQCKSQCDEKSIKAQCERAWVVQIDFVTPSIASTCFAKSKAKACYEEKKAPAKEAETKCATDGKDKCATQHETCNKEGKTDATFKDAKEFCDSRKKMCQEQVTKRCLAEHKKALEDAEAECEEADKEELSACKEKTLKEEQEKQMGECEKSQGPKCNEKCEGDCDVTAMSKCLKNLESENDEAEMFCKDFWQLLHGSSELDPVTGDPIVLLTKRHQ